MVQTNKERIGYLDTAKALLIMLVVLGHVLNVLNPRYDRRALVAMQSFIYTFHMPAFFILNGLLFDSEKQRRRGIGDYLRRRAKALLIPYLFFETIGIAARFVLYGQPVTTGVVKLLTVRCNIGADWFLPALFMGGLGMVLWSRNPNRIVAAVSAAVCFVIPKYLPSGQVFLVTGRGMLAYAFIMTGFLIRWLLISEKNAKMFRITGAVLGTGCIALLGLKFGGNDFYSCTVSHPLLFAVGGVCGTVGILGAARLVDHPLMRSVGRHTLAVMGTHQPIIYAMTKRIPTLSGGSMMGGLMLLFVIVGIEIPLVYVLDHFCPLLVGRSK